MANDLGLTATHEVDIADITYRGAGDDALPARAYRPRGAGPFPAVIEVHGGAWASGDRLNNAVLDQALAESGIAVLAIDFRMPPAHRYPASIADINFATRWLKAHAAEFNSRADLVGGLATSSGAHQLLLSLLRPRDPRYAALPLAEAGSHDATFPYVVLCWPIADPLARYRMAKSRGNDRLVAAHDSYFPDEAAMAEGNPQAILDAGETGSLPPALIVQGTNDDNVTPDMADKLAAGWRARGGEVALHKFDGQPHTFIVRDPAAEASREATRLIRDFILRRAG